MSNFLTRVGDVYKTRNGLTKVKAGSLNSTVMTLWCNDNLWTPTVYVQGIITYYAYGLIALTLIYSCTPIGTVINNYVLSNKDDESKKDNLYLEHVKFFDKDYDTYNPLTAKAGKLRLLGYQLEGADDDEKERIKAQME
jgi:hypothetical protein